LTPFQVYDIILDKMNINFIQIDDFSKYISADQRDKFLSVDWTELNFLTYDIAATNMTEYEVSEDLGVYRRDLDSGLSKIEDFTHKLDIEAGVILEKEDYEITATAYFFKGELKEVKVKEINFIDRKEREEMQRRFDESWEQLGERAKRFESKWFRIWNSIISHPLGLIRYILGGMIKFCWKIQKFLTGS